MIKLLGVIDLLLALWIIGLHFSFFESARLTFVFVFYLVCKTLLFWGDIASLLDGICAVYLVFLGFGVSCFLTWLVFAYFVQKGIFSLLG